MEDHMNGSDSDTSSRGPSYVLVVDSDPPSLVALSRILQRLDYHVCTAGTAEEALDMVKVSVPYLVLTDMSLPGMNGFELIQCLKQDPATVGIPVIVKTGQLTPALDQMCRQAGAEACVQKPVQIEDLYRKVQAAIEPKPRSHIRISTLLPVCVNNRPLDLGSCEYASMLSANGMYIRTQNPYPVKMKVLVQIELPKRTVSADAKVVYCHTLGQGPHGSPGMGLYFVEITPEDQDYIRNYVNAEVMKGIDPGWT
jgi:two-component system, OmpR family, alkaline phosphatase synthesis response regulator PhoP